MGNAAASCMGNEAGSQTWPDVSTKDSPFLRFSKNTMNLNLSRVSLQFVGQDLQNRDQQGSWYIICTVRINTPMCVCVENYVLEVIPTMTLYLTVLPNSI